MESCLFCIQRCFGGLNRPSRYAVAKDQVIPVVLLDTANMGNDVVIVKNGHRICGTGAALANAPIVQNKAYFEVKVQQSGIWGIGLATTNVNLNRIPLGYDSQSWILRNDGKIMHDNQVLYKLPTAPQEGDLIAIAFDHIEARFFINNQPIEFAVNGVKGGDIYPVLYVDDGAILDAAFTTFTYPPPPGYDRILVEKSLL